MRKITPPLIAFLSCLLLLLLVITEACRKTDKQDQNYQESIGEARFFNQHSSADPLVKGIAEFMRRKNTKERFVEVTTKKIGFPRWDKARTVKGGAPAGIVSSDNDSVDITYIPFVRDSQNYVNAAWVIKTTPRDTAFGYLCDWQYADYGFDTAQTGWTARNVFHIFSMMDKDVFSRRQFRITDARLLTQQEKDHLYNNNLSFDSAVVVYTMQSPKQSVSLNSLLMPVTICDDITVCIRRGGLLAFRSVEGNGNQVLGDCPPGTIPMAATICTDVLVYIPSSGGGNDTPPGNGGGGGGSSGPGESSTPPECPGGFSGRNNLIGTCTPGWEPSIPIEDDPQLIIQQLEQWDDEIIIDPSVRPCVQAVFNAVKNSSSGAIAEMIYIMSQQIPGFNWNISEVPQLAAPYASASALTTAMVNSNSSTQLNQAVIANATNLSIARTIIHEAVHAFIYNYVLNNANLTQSQKDQILALPFAKKLKEFFKLKYPPPSFDNSFHNLMAKNFHDDIATLLKEICPSFNINLNSADLDLLCSDMAWAGLEDSNPDSPWMDMNNLTEEDRIRITKRNDIELNNLGNYTGTINGYFISLNQAGTKACQ